MEAIQTLSAEDRLDIVDALYRLGAGIDAGDAALLASVFAEDATVDFGPAARFMGIDFPVLTGRDQTAQTLAATVGRLDTTHVVSNPRIGIDGAGVVLNAIVEAAHFPPGDHSRRCIMKNRYTATLYREAELWRISSLDVRCAWYDGDPRVLLGQWARFALAPSCGRSFARGGREHETPSSVASAMLSRRRRLPQRYRRAPNHRRLTRTRANR